MRPFSPETEEIGIAYRVLLAQIDSDCDNLRSHYQTLNSSYHNLNAAFNNYKTLTQIESNYAKVLAYASQQ